MFRADQVQPVGFPYTWNTPLLDVPQAAARYDRIDLHATSANLQDIETRILAWAKQHLIASGGQPSDTENLIFKIGVSGNQEVANALGLWSTDADPKAEEVVYSGALEQLAGAHDEKLLQPGRVGAVEALQALGATVVAMLVGDMSMALWDEDSGEYRHVPFSDARLVNYPEEKTGNVHRDRKRANAPPTNPDRVQMLLKSGPGQVGFSMCSPVNTIFIHE